VERIGATNNIFISYRRDDAAAYAGRVADRLGEFVGPEHVFMDVESIHPGQNFAEAIDRTLSQCSNVLVIIGPRWFDILRQREASQEKDYVVHEVSSALGRVVNVVPVFVGGATSAALSQLPHELADLSSRQAIELRDDSFKDDCTRLAASLNLTRRRSLSGPWLWAGAAAVVAIALVLAYNAGVGPWRAARERSARVAQLLETAATQTSQAEYESAFDSYQQILTIESTNRTALDGQVDAAMRWIENFHVLVSEGQKAEDLAGPPLSRVKAVLEAGLARTGGRDMRAADILAHLGWTHWLNQKLAFKEFDGAQRFFSQSLSIDPSNVFANAMMGNWLLQTRGDTAAAAQHFEGALATGKERPLVRQMQLGGLLYNNAPGMHAAFAKALNDMRSNNEPLDPGIKSRAGYLYDVTSSQGNEYRVVLAAVPPADNWKTYLWISPPAPADAGEQLRRDFVHASLAEFSDDRAGAVSEFRTLLPKLKAQGMSYRMTDYAQSAIKRLSGDR
jgi:tetratricopeptide (TPR) repeat protein